MTKPPTQAYLIGITEGRKAKRRYERDCGPMDRATVARNLETSQELCAQGFAGEMLDFLRGERDFWKNQVQKMANAR